MDWISAAFDCSIDHAWMTLKERIKADLEQWRRRPEAPGKVNLSEDDRLPVISAVESFGSGPWARVEKKKASFAVYSGQDRNSPATAVNGLVLVPTVNAKGECRLLLGDEELEFWQVSRRLLQPILFG